MGGEWWNSAVFLEPDLKNRRFSSDAGTENSSVHHWRSIDQLSSLSNVLDFIRVLAKIENISEIKIAALALQLVSI